MPATYFLPMTPRSVPLPTAMRCFLPPFSSKCTRVPLPVVGSSGITLLMCTGASFWMRPPCGLRWLGRTCFHTRLMPSTTTRSLSVITRRTRPVLPLSAPVVTITTSPALILRAISLFPISDCRLPIELQLRRLSFGNRQSAIGNSSNHFARQRHDLHEVLVAQLAGDGAEDARAARVVLLVDHHRRVLVEADVAAVLAEHGLLRANDHAADDLPLLHLPARQRLLHRADDHVPDVGHLAL